MIIKLGEHRQQTERIPSLNNDCPIFSTICLHAFVKTNHFNDHDKYAALEQVKLLFKYLLDFFYANQISVGFAMIKCRRGYLTNIPSLSNLFTSSIQLYAFSMLRNVGYSIEQKISQQKSIRQSLLKLADNDDDKFYRLCLYLFRRASEYHFLNVSNQ